MWLDSTRFGLVLTQLCFHSANFGRIRLGLTKFGPNSIRNGSGHAKVGSHSAKFGLGLTSFGLGSTPDVQAASAREDDCTTRRASGRPALGEFYRGSARGVRNMGPKATWRSSLGDVLLMVDQGRSEKHRHHRQQFLRRSRISGSDACRAEFRLDGRRISRIRPGYRRRCCWPQCPHTYTRPTPVKLR